MIQMRAPLSGLAPDANLNGAVQLAFSLKT